jgi:hypothetical protein
LRRAIEQAIAASPAPLCVVTTPEALAQASGDWRRDLGIGNLIIGRVVRIDQLARHAMRHLLALCVA